MKTVVFVETPSMIVAPIAKPPEMIALSFLDAAVTAFTFTA